MILNPTETDIYSEVLRVADEKVVNLAITTFSVGKVPDDALKISSKRGRNKSFRETERQC